VVALIAARAARRRRRCRAGAVAALALAAVLVPVTMGGCGGSCDPRRGRDAGVHGEGDAGAADAGVPSRVMIDLVERLATCDVEHRGLLIDAGTEQLMGRLGWQWTIPAGLAVTEHDGATWTKAFDRSIELSFTLSETTPIFVAARAQGAASRAAAVLLDDQPLGTLTFARDQIRIATTPTTHLPVDRGAHTLTIRFSGRGKAEAEPWAELDWIRIGIPDEDQTTYGAPTLRDLVAPAAALDGIPHRAIALRAPGSVRCAMRPPKNGRVRVALGLQGAGEADADLRYLRDGAPPVVIGKVHLTGGERARWTDVELPLPPETGEVGALELRALTAPRSARILFGDPAITLPATDPPAAPAARAVVVVVLDGVERADLPPWSGPRSPLGTISDIALTGTAFERHRAPSTIVAAVVASLLSGLPPRGHGLADAGARLPQSMPNIGRIARDGSVRAAMFTGVPTTFKAFGFAQGWEKFVEHSPVAGTPSTAPIDDAAAWITEVAREARGAKLLAVVHARGAHPPWEVTAKELAAIPPPDYAGMIDPRRAGQVLARARQRRSGSVLSPTDAARVRSLATLALTGQDRALGALVGALRSAGLWDETLLVVTGDVSSGASEPMLYAEGLPLREPVLTLPLLVRFPGGAQGGARSDAPTEVYDVTRTVAAALGLALPKESLGRDLAAVAAGAVDPGVAPQVATLGDRYSARWADVVLSGKMGHPPHLCDLRIDPTCAFDRREIMPLAAFAVFRRTVAHDLATRAPPEQREPATVDADTTAALSVWGAGE
jgi:hypothetical protein